MYLKLLYSAAITANQCKQYEKAYQLLNTSLSQKQSYLYFESKVLRADVAEKLNKTSEAENECREIMLTSTKPETTIKAVLLLSRIFQKQQKWSELTTTASFCLPMVSSKQKNLPEVQQCLALLCDGMNKLNDKSKLKDMLMLYLQTYPEGDQYTEFSKLIKSLP